MPFHECNGVGERIVRNHRLWIRAGQQYHLAFNLPKVGVVLSAHDGKEMFEVGRPVGVDRASGTGLQVRPEPYAELFGGDRLLAKMWHDIVGDPALPLFWIWENLIPMFAIRRCKSERNQIAVEAIEFRVEIEPLHSRQLRLKGVKIQVLTIMACL